MRQAKNCGMQMAWVASEVGETVVSPQVWDYVKEYVIEGPRISSAFLKFRSDFRKFVREFKVVQS